MGRLTSHVCETSYYVDEPDVIRLLEAASSDHLLSMRPSRMGKTLLCNMLDVFYDYKGAEDFPVLSDGLAIAHHNSPNESQVHVLYLSLSRPPCGRLTMESGFRAMHLTNGAVKSGGQMCIQDVVEAGQRQLNGIHGDTKLHAKVCALHGGGACSRMGRRRRRLCLSQCVAVRGGAAEGRMRHHRCCCRHLSRCRRHSGRGR